MTKERFKVIPAVFIIMEREYKIFLMLRKNTGYMDGMYGLPSGHVEAGESLTHAIIREAREEAGVTLDQKRLKLCHVMYQAKHDETGERANFFFTAEVWGGEPENCEPQKCGGVGWFPIDSLPPNIIPYIKTALAHIRNNVFLSELGWDESAS